MTESNDASTDLKTDLPAKSHYDVVVVGGRAAGASTAMLLALGGADVLVVDKGSFGADTMSTHALLKGGVYQLYRWGLLDQVIAADTPPAHRTSLHTGDDTVTVEMRPLEGIDALYAPKRTVLDPILVRAAAAAGAELCFERVVEGPEFDSAGRVVGVSVRDDDGGSRVVGADLVVGADGMYSRFAKAVEAPTTHQGEGSMGVVYGYFDTPQSDSYDWYFSPTAAAGTIPTNGSQTLGFAGTTSQRFRDEVRADTEAGFWTLLGEVAPAHVERLQGAERVGRLRAFGGLQGHLRKPSGPGWALVGDAGYFKDPLSAHGLTDSMRDAEILARAVQAGDLAEYEATRDELSIRHFELTDELASFSWDTDRVQEVLYQISKATVPEIEYLRGLGSLTAA